MKPNAMPAAAAPSAQSKSLRLFYALWPDAATRIALQRWQEPLRGRNTPADNLHLTLAFLGQQAATLLPVLQDILQQLPPAPAALVLDRIAYFPRHRIACAEMSEVPPALITLQQALQQALVQHGIACEEHAAFRPHVTLTRAAPRPPAGAPEAIRWQADQVVLVQSQTLAEGACYHVLAMR